MKCFIILLYYLLLFLFELHAVKKPFLLQVKPFNFPEKTFIFRPKTFLFSKLNLLKKPFFWKLRVDTLYLPQ